ncbi:MAG: proton-conducting transporter transmembrane domain-containing protein [Planctomycetaceae bacterium]
MSELHLPWLELSILIPLVGGLWVGRLRDADRARERSLWITGVTLAFTLGTWIDFAILNAGRAGDRWQFLSQIGGRDVLVIDELSAPLLPLAALLYALTALATLRTKVRRFSFAWSLFSEAIVLATFSCREPLAIVALLIAGVVPPFIELRARSRSTRVNAFHMLLYAGLLMLGWALVEREERGAVHSWWALGALLAAVLIRHGVAPFHCWMTDLFEHATFGTSLLFVTPMVGAYGAARLILPIAPDWMLRGIGLLSLLTAVYAAGMALVQREARRFFCYLFISHSALVLTGLESLTPIGLTGGLCVWLSVGVSLGGFGLALRALEARRGRLSLTDYHGLYEHAPALAVCFLLTGLASVGFPGTFGFVGTELLIDGAVQIYPHVGVAVVLAGALNGIAVLQAYFILLTGRRHISSVSLQMRLRERVAVLTLAALLLGLGLFPQWGVASRYVAATEILKERQTLSLNRSKPAQVRNETASSRLASSRSTSVD